MATRIGLLEGGRLAQVGTPTEIYERPVSRSVAAFMGAANILPARVRGPGVLDVAGSGRGWRQADTTGFASRLCMSRSARSGCAWPGAR